MAGSYCTQCGTELFGGVKFCGECGSAVSPIPATPPPASAPPAAAVAPAAIVVRGDTILSVAALVAILFASFAQTPAGGSLMGMPGWMSAVWRALQRATQEIDGSAVAAGMSTGLSGGGLASVLTYLLFLIPVVASLLVWRELRGARLRAWRLRAAAAFALIPVVAIGPWYLVVRGVPRGYLEYAAATLNTDHMDGYRASRGGWDDGTLITIYVVGVVMLLVAARLATAKPVDAAEPPPR